MVVVGEELTPHRRAVLADKGRRLYRKFCGTLGRGICAESFAVYHIGRGEAAVAEDLLAHLDGEVARLEQADPHGWLAATRGLADRIRRHLEAVPGSEGTPNQPTGRALRLFVMCGPHSPVSR
jgi:hypothetical protein